MTDPAVLDALAEQWVREHDPDGLNLPSAEPDHEHHPADFLPDPDAVLCYPTDHQPSKTTRRRQNEDADDSSASPRQREPGGPSMQGRVVDQPVLVQDRHGAFPAVRGAIAGGIEEVERLTALADEMARHNRDRRLANAELERRVQQPHKPRSLGPERLDDDDPNRCANPAGCPFRAVRDKRGGKFTRCEACSRYRRGRGGAERPAKLIRVQLASGKWWKATAEPAALRVDDGPGDLPDLPLYLLSEPDDEWLSEEEQLG